MSSLYIKVGYTSVAYSRDMSMVYPGKMEFFRFYSTVVQRFTLHAMTKGLCSDRSVIRINTNTIHVFIFHHILITNLDQFGIEVRICLRFS